jgi:hypothetical protein
MNARTQALAHYMANEDPALQAEKDKADATAAMARAGSGLLAKTKAMGLFGNKAAEMNLREIAGAAEAKSQQIAALQEARRNEVQATADFNVSHSRFGFQSSERAVASRYFSHDFGTDNPYRERMATAAARIAMDTESYVKAVGGNLVGDAAQGAAKAKTK